MTPKYKDLILDEEGFIVSEPLQTIREDKSGFRILTRDFVVSVGGREITVEEGFDTDFSSIPRKLLICAMFLIVFLCRYASGSEVFQFMKQSLPDIVMWAISGLCKWSPYLVVLLLLVPGYSQVDMAGAVHDYLYRYSHKIDGRFLTRSEIDLIWLKLAITGQHKANILQALVCWGIGLRIGALGAWVGYNKHRKIKLTKEALQKSG